MYVSPDASGEDGAPKEFGAAPNPVRSGVLAVFFFAGRKPMFVFEFDAGLFRFRYARPASTPLLQFPPL